MQQLIAFMVNLIKALVDLCMANELLSWTIYLFVFACIVSVITFLYKR